MPLPPAVTVIHDALEVAVRAHVPADAVTVTLPVEAAAAGVALVADSVKVHGAVTVTVAEEVTVPVALVAVNV